MGLSMLKFLKPPKQKNKISTEKLLVNNGLEFSGLATELLFHITAELQKQEIASLAMTCKLMRRLIYPILYRDVRLIRPKYYLHVFRLLLLNPVIAQSVHSLVITYTEGVYQRYNGPAPNAVEKLDIRLRWELVFRPVLSDVIQVAPLLVNLVRFEWKLPIAPRDKMWDCLHKSCPKLKSIAFNTPFRDLNRSPSSHLFPFTSLNALHLGIEVSNSILGSLPVEFDLFLDQVCLNLVSLSLAEYNTPLTTRKGFYRIAPFLDRHYPQLRNFILDYSYTPNYEEDPKVLSAFLSKHPGIEEICLKNFPAGFWCPVPQFTLPPCAFKGTLRALKSFGSDYDIVNLEITRMTSPIPFTTIDNDVISFTHSEKCYYLEDLVLPLYSDGIIESSRFTSLLEDLIYLKRLCVMWRGGTEFPWKAFIIALKTSKPKLSCIEIRRTGLCLYYKSYNYTLHPPANIAHTLYALLPTLIRVTVECDEHVLECERLAIDEVILKVVRIEDCRIIQVARFSLDNLVLPVDGW